MPKNDVVRNEGGNRAQEFSTTSFLAFSALKMPKTTSLEIPGLDSPLGSLDSPLACRQRLSGLAGKDWQKAFQQPASAGQLVWDGVEPCSLRILLMGTNDDCCNS